MERLKTTQQKGSNANRLSKTQFKRFIDNIQQSMKIKKSFTSDLDSHFGNQQLDRKRLQRMKKNKKLIIPQSAKQLFGSQKNLLSEYRASINIEFNKLNLDRKSKFNQSRPNNKDLTIFLPEIKQMKSKDKKEQDFQIKKYIKKWKNNKLGHKTCKNKLIGNKQNKLNCSIQNNHKYLMNNFQSNKKISSSINDNNQYEVINNSTQQNTNSNSNKLLLTLKLKNFAQSYQTNNNKQPLIKQSTINSIRQYTSNKTSDLTLQQKMKLTKKYSSNISKRFTQLKRQIINTQARHTVKQKKFFNNNNNEKQTKFNTYSSFHNSKVDQNSIKKQRINKNGKNDTFQITRIHQNIVQDV